MTDWKKGHKPICFPVEVHKMEAENLRLTSQWCSARVEESEQMRRQVLAADPKCSICFEQPMVQPIVLERCHHAFCFRCLKGWNNVHQTEDIFAPSTMTCPLCRQEIPNIVETINADIMLLLTSAHEMNASESFVLEQCTKALDKMELLKDIEQAVKDPLIAEKYRHQLFLFQLRIHDLKKEYDKALMLARGAEERMGLAVQNRLKIQANMAQLASMEGNPKHAELKQRTQDFLFANPNASPGQHIEIILMVAQIQVLQEDWIGAKATFMSVMQYKDHGKNAGELLQHAETCSGLSRCLFELGEYERAATFGEMALVVNRHLEGCHKYVALSYFAMPSRRREANQFAAEAVIYEAPWNKEHRAGTIDFYRSNFLK